MQFSAATPLGLIAGFVAYRAAYAWWLSRYHRHRISFLREKMLHHEVTSLLHRSGVTVVAKPVDAYCSVQSHLSASPFCYDGGATTLLEAPLNHFLSDACTGQPMCVRMSSVLVDQPSRGQPVLEALFSTYAALFDTGIVGDTYLLVDAWNIMTAVLHHKLLAALGRDSEVVANGGVGELSGEWDTALSTATVLNDRYNILKHPHVMALMECNERVVSDAAGIVVIGPKDGRVGATLLILELSGALMSRVAALANVRMSIFPALSQVAAIVRRTCSVRWLVGLASIVVSIRLTLSIGISDVHWEDETYLSRFLANNQQVPPQQLYDNGVHAWQLLGKHFVGTLLFGVMQMLSRVLGNLSLYVAGGIALTLTEESIASTLAGSVESEVVMAVAAQDMPYILGDRLRQVLASLGCLRMFSEQMMDSVERQVRGLYALRAGIPFPLVVAAFCALQRSQRFLTSRYTMANLVVDNMEAFYLSDLRDNGSKKPHSARWANSSSLGGTNNCLVDESSVPHSAGMLRSFAQVDRRFLAAAFPQGDTESHADFIPSLAEHSPSRTQRPLEVLLHQVVEKAIGASAATRHAQCGLSTLLSVVAHRCATKLGCTPPSESVVGIASCWCILGSIVEWPVCSDALMTIQCLSQAALCYQACGASADRAVCSQTCQLLHQLAVLIERDLNACDRRRTTQRSATPEERPTVEKQRAGTVTCPQTEAVDCDVPLPAITSSLTKDRRLTETLRACGKELDVVKACTVSEAYDNRVVARSSMSSFLRTHWLDVYISSVEDFLMRVVGNYFYGNLFLETSNSSRGMGDIRAASRRVQDFVSPPIHTIPHYDHHSGKKGLEQLFRLEETAHRSMKQSEIARNAQPFSTLNNALSIRSACIDRPISASMLAVAEQELLCAPSDASRSMLAFSVDFINVSKSFGYKKVLSNVSFSVKRGEFVGIVGVSGAGKTTILNLLLRMFEPDEGRILVNGRDIAEFPVRMLRRRVAYVCQDFKENGFFPTSTIAANIALGDLSREDMEVSINEALLQADAKTFVDTKPLKKKTLPDEKTFSGGEIQRLVIARALMRRPQRTGLLVLDEATSAVDGATEQLIVSNMLGGRRRMECNPSQRISCIAVAHRLATLTAADKILVLHDGAIVEEGPWQLLARNTSSRFHQLLMLQTVRGEVLDASLESTSRTASAHAAPSTVDNIASPATPCSGTATPSVSDNGAMEALRGIVANPVGIDADVVAKAARILACMHGSSVLNHNSCIDSSA